MFPWLYTIGPQRRRIFLFRELGVFPSGVRCVCCFPCLDLILSEPFPDTLSKGNPHSCSVLKPLLGDFPGGPVVKTQRVQCRGRGFDPWLGN